MSSWGLDTNSGKLLLLLLLLLWPQSWDCANPQQNQSKLQWQWIVTAEARGQSAAVVDLRCANIMAAAAAVHCSVVDCACQGVGISLIGSGSGDLSMEMGIGHSWW